jgi:hypothetical protein
MGLTLGIETSFAKVVVGSSVMSRGPAAMRREMPQRKPVNPFQTAK